MKHTVVVGQGWHPFAKLVTFLKKHGLIDANYREYFHILFYFCVNFFGIYFKNYFLWNLSYNYSIT
jgi:hypothetical protein